jgi:hypothetical protein
MKKSILFLLAALVSFGISAKLYADARVDSLGTDVREVDDIDLIWFYPNMALQYKNTADFRLNTPNGAFGQGVNEWGGVITDESPSLGGVVGVYVNAPGELNTPASGLLDDTDLRFYYVGSNDIDVFWASGMGDGSIGLHFSYGDNGVPHGVQFETYGLGLGLGFTNVGPFGQFNIRAVYDKTNNTNTLLSANNTDNGDFYGKLGALGQSDLDNASSIRAFLDLTMGQMALMNIDDFDDDWVNVTLGAALTHKVNGGKGLVNTGLILNYEDSDFTMVNKPTNDGISWVLLWNGSVESQVADWLTLRAGIEKVLVAREYDSSPNPPTAPTYIDNATTQNVSFNTGFGVNWQNFTLNGAVSAGSLENSINNVQPGAGLFFAGTIVTVTEADLRYKF